MNRLNARLAKLENGAGMNSGPHIDVIMRSIVSPGKPDTPRLYSAAIVGSGAAYIRRNNNESESEFVRRVERLKSETKFPL